MQDIKLYTVLPQFGKNYTFNIFAHTEKDQKTVDPHGRSLIFFFSIVHDFQSLSENNFFFKNQRLRQPISEIPIMWKALTQESDQLSKLQQSGEVRQPSGQEPTCQCRGHERCGFDPWVRNFPWRRKWQHTPVFLSGKSHGQVLQSMGLQRVRHD